MFNEYESKESHLVPLIRKYQLVNIQYIYDIKKNKLKRKNIIKLNTSIRYSREVTKSLKIGTNGLEIKAKEKDYTTADAKNINFFLELFIYIHKFLFFWPFQKINYNYSQFCIGMQST